MKTQKFAQANVFAEHRQAASHIVFKNLRFHSHILRFHVDSKLKRKNKVAFSFDNVLV